MVRLVLGADLDEAAKDALTAAVEAAISAQPTTVLVEMSAITAYDPRLRGLLLALQRVISAHRGRAVYVADRPRIRGLALWVIHMAEDKEAKIVGNVAAAVEWLRGSEERVAAAERGTFAALARLSGAQGGDPR